jgi:hypothetical protein
MNWLDPEALPVPDLGLACRRCGYPLAGLSRHECPECGRAFSLQDHLPPGDMPTLVADGELVRATPNVVELLQAYCITFIEDHGPLAVLNHPGMISGESATIGVVRDRYFDAVDLIRRMKLSEPLPPAPELVPQEAWLCGSCYEENPGTFELCWSCGAPYEGSYD